MNVGRRTIPKLSHDPSPHPIEVTPFGRNGAGLWTAHPVGLMAAVGLLLIGIVGLPEARWFLSVAVPLGGICGFFLWRSHR